MQKCEMPKNDIFTQVRGHEKLQFFRQQNQFRQNKTESQFSSNYSNVKKIEKIVL